MKTDEQLKERFKSASQQQENNDGWISKKDRLPKHLELCNFLLNNGSVIIGRCRYYEYGDSELTDCYGLSISYLVRTYPLWELHNFDRTKYFDVTHWMPLQNKPKN